MIFLYIMLGGLVSFCFSPFLVKALQVPFVYFLYTLQGSPFGFFLSLIYCFFLHIKKKKKSLHYIIVIIIIPTKEDDFTAFSCCNLIKFFHLNIYLIL